MIPIKLTIEGLYSYQKRQSIDFTRLTEAGLFGIFGPVGCGKSSILEAITFSIYGKTDRLNLSGDNRNYNMMNLKSNELFIDFTFETGKEQTPFRAVVRSRRNSKRFEDVKTLERIAYRKDGENWIPVEIRSLEQAVGLSYENFKRTIIIPQGQFQEFLQLGDRDRTQMMKELFRLDRFELFYKVTSLESKNNSRKQNAEGQLQQLGDLQPEQLEYYREQLDLLRKSLQEHSKLLSDDQKQESQWRQIQELAKKIAEAENRLKQLQAQEPQFHLLEKKITQYEQCLIKFKNLIDALRTSDRKIEEKNLLIGQETGKLKAVEEDIAKAEDSFAGVKTNYEERERLKQHADELHKMLRIKELTRLIERDQERFEKGNSILQQTISEIDKKTKDREKLEGAIRTDKAKLPDLNVLAKIKTWHVEKRNLDRQSEELNTGILKYQDEIRRINEDFQSWLQDPLLTGSPSINGIPAVVQYLHDKIEEFKKKIRELDLAASHYSLQEKLEAYAIMLQEGEACPLCGATHHPLIYSASSVKEEQTKIEKAREMCEKETDRIHDLIRMLNELNSQLRFNRKQLMELQEKHQEQEKKIAAHQQLFRWESFQDEAAVSKAFDLAERMQLELKKSERELDQLNRHLEKDLRSKERYQTEIDKIKMTLTVGETEYKTLSGQIALISTEQYALKSSAEIENEKDSFLKQYMQLEKQYNELSKRLTDLRKIKDMLEGSLKANRNELMLEQEQHESVSRQLSEQLIQAGYRSAEEVTEILDQSIDLDQEKQKLALFRQNILFAINQTSLLRKEMDNRTYDPEAHHQLMDEIVRLSEKISHENQEQGRISELKNKLQKDLETRDLLRKSLEKLEIRAENIKTLKSLFKGSGFVNYISSVHLQNLCRAANERFYRLTRQKLSLEITEDNNFQIRDFMNGGKVRSVKTLSGGQTFQAALSLALALADNIQKITESNQNFFFLDEGFGSLDKDSLTVVFDTLKSLRRENRIVGVISHVEEMQQEIDVHLRIDSRGEEGSIIHQSWQE